MKKQTALKSYWSCKMTERDLMQSAHAFTNTWKRHNCILKCSFYSTMKYNNSLCKMLDFFFQTKLIRTNSQYCLLPYVIYKESVAHSTPHKWQLRYIFHSHLFSVGIWVCIRSFWKQRRETFCCLLQLRSLYRRAAFVTWDPSDSTDQLNKSPVQ